jgi:hypothetical protein
MRLIGERRNLFKCIAVVIFSFANLPAKSDPIRGYRAVHITYDGSAKVLKVAVERVELRWNDYAEMERLEEERNRFILWNRVSYDEDRFVKSIDPAIRTFDTSAGELRVKVIPVPGNINGNGRCGAHMGADVSVSLDGVTVVERRKVIPSDCNSVDLDTFTLKMGRILDV